MTLFALDAALGEARKHTGMQLALDLDEEWRDAVVTEFREWARQQKALGVRRVTIEEFRSQTLLQPQSHKAWGSLPGLLCRAGILKPAVRRDGSPVMVRAAAPRTHRHFVRTWSLAAVQREARPA